MLLFMAFLMVIVWGSAFTLVSIGVKYISPLWLVTYRLIIGAIIVIIYVKFKVMTFLNKIDFSYLKNLSGKKFLITGGDGMLGSSFLHQLKINVKNP